MNVVGLLHPGAMGVTVGAAFVRHRRVHEVMWASQGRSDDTVARAQSAGLCDVGTLDAVAEAADVIVAVCPPHAAIELAEAVAATGFDRLYVDANAVAPATVRRIAEVLPKVVDGGIVGPPAAEAGTTRLFLSGDGAGRVSALLEGSPLEAVVVGTDVGAASALKLAYAAWTKGSAALLLQSLAYATAEGVDGELRSEWERSQPAVAASIDRRAAAVGPKAWRFEGEMREIAEAMAAVGLPDGFHLAAAEAYARLAVDSPTDADQASTLLRRPPPRP